MAATRPQPPPSYVKFAHEHTRAVAAKPIGSAWVYRPLYPVSTDRPIIVARRCSVSSMSVEVVGGEAARPGARTGDIAGIHGERAAKEEAIPEAASTHRPQPFATTERYAGSGGGPEAATLKSLIPRSPARTTISQPSKARVRVRCIGGLGSATKRCSRRMRRGRWRTRRRATRGAARAAAARASTKLCGRRACRIAVHVRPTGRAGELYTYEVDFVRIPHSSSLRLRPTTSTGQERRADHCVALTRSHSTPPIAK